MSDHLLSHSNSFGFEMEIDTAGCRAYNRNYIVGGAYAMDYSIVWVRGHVEVYDWAGRFCFSADSEREAREELEGAA